MGSVAGGVLVAASGYEYLKERKVMSQKKNVRKCARIGMSVSEAKEVCQDRKGWRKLKNGCFV